jgi:hypothetical protein
VDDPRIAILLNPGLDFLFDRFLGSICATVRPKPRSFFNLLDGEYKFSGIPFTTVGGIPPFGMASCRSETQGACRGFSWLESCTCMALSTFSDKMLV